MERSIVNGNKNVEYRLKRSFKSSSIRILVSHLGSVSVTSPYLIPEEKIDSFVMSKFSWIIEKIEYFKNTPRVFLSKHTKREIEEYKKIAKILVLQRLEYFNVYYHFTYNKVTIKNTSSRWGSCSSKGNLNFNYKLALISPLLVDYIVVHELCHLKEMNHSKKFWDLVEEKIPNHKELRRQLKSYR